MVSLASTWRRVRAPGAPALHRALRVALTATTGFVLGRYALDDPQTAIYATLTPIALLGLGVVGGPERDRLRAYAGALAAAAAVTAVGTLASEDTVAASLTLFAGALAASQAGIAGSNAAGLSRSVVLVLVVSTGIPAPDSAVSSRLVGVAIGGALALPAAWLLWPERGDVAYRRRLGAALAPLAVAMRALAEGAPAAASLQRATAAMANARAFALGIAERPLGAARMALAERVLEPGIRELGALLVDVSHAERREPDRALLGAVGETLERAAAVLDDPRAAPPDPTALEPARRRYRDSSAQRLGELLSRGVDAGELDRACEDAFRLRRLAAVAAAIAAQARVAARLDADAGIPGTAYVRPRSAANRVADQLRLRLTLESAVLRNGLRLAAGLAAARAVAGAFDFQHGFWVVFATLTVTRASARGTWADAGRAVVGTAIGAVLATALLFAFEAEADVYVALLPLFAFLAVYGGAVAFVLGQTGFTLLIVAIFNLAGPPQWDIALIRLEDVAVGAAVGVAIGVAAWPRGPGGQLRRALAHAIDAGAGYARAVASALLDPGAAETAPARRDAVWAARRAEDVFVAYLDEVLDRPAAIERWSALLERAQRLWYEASIVEENPRPETHDCPRLAAALQHAVDQVAVELGAAGDALRRRASPGNAAALLPAGGDLGRHALACAAERGRLPGIVDLLGVRAWIAELGRDLDHLRSVVGALAEPAARAAVR